MLAWASGKRRRAEQMFAEAVRMAEEHCAQLLVANACFEHGRMLGLGGDATRGRRQLERALEIYRRVGAKPAAARTELWLERFGTSDSTFV
jgi:hypothetical protein